jgi:hypothetical protein
VFSVPVDVLGADRVPPVQSWHQEDVLAPRWQPRRPGGEAALLAVTFFAFATSRVSFIQVFGIGTGLAIPVDATLIRGVLVPAFMHLAGDFNWWSPAPLRRLHQHLQLSEVPATRTGADEPESVTV